MPYVMRQGRRIEVEWLETPGIARKRPRPFIKTPVDWIAEATKATGTPKAFVALWLLHLSWKAKSPTFPLPNVALQRWGVGRHSKYRALRELEAAGLITVTRRHRQSPIVTLHLTMCV